MSINKTHKLIRESQIMGENMRKLKHKLKQSNYRTTAIIIWVTCAWLLSVYISSEHSERLYLAQEKTSSQIRLLTKAINEMPLRGDIETLTLVTCYDDTCYSGGQDVGVGER